MFLSVYLADYNCIEMWWANMEEVLVDLVPECATLQEAVYTYFVTPNC